MQRGQARGCVNYAFQTACLVLAAPGSEGSRAACEEAVPYDGVVRRGRPSTKAAASRRCIADMLLTRVDVSHDAYRCMLSHALTTEHEEVMGLLAGA